jgi:hypothetical protein
MLRLRRAEQQQRLLREQECLDRVEALLQLIHQENTMNTDAVIIKDTNPLRFASIRKTIPFALCLRVPLDQTKNQVFQISVTS